MPMRMVPKWLKVAFFTTWGSIPIFRGRRVKMHQKYSLWVWNSTAEDFWQYKSCKGGGRGNSWNPLIPCLHKHPKLCGNSLSWSCSYNQPLSRQCCYSDICRADGTSLEGVKLTKVRMAVPWFPGGGPGPRNQLPAPSGRALGWTCVNWPQPCWLRIKGLILLVLFPSSCQSFPPPGIALNFGQFEQGNFVPLENTFSVNSVFSCPDFS